MRTSELVAALMQVQDLKNRKNIRQQEGAKRIGLSSVIELKTIENSSKNLLNKRDPFKQAKREDCKQLQNLVGWNSSSNCSTLGRVTNIASVETRLQTRQQDCRRGSEKEKWSKKS